MSEKTKQLLLLFHAKPYTLEMSAGKLAKRQKCTAEEIRYAKSLFRANQATKKVKILVLDIETAPLRAYVWNRWKQNIKEVMNNRTNLRELVVISLNIFSR